MSVKAILRPPAGGGGGGGTVISVSGSGGATGLTLTGGPITVSGTLTLGGVLNVANGGSGLNTTTPYAIFAGGTTSTSPYQQVSGLGTAGQVLTSNGAGALPTWQVIPAGGTVTSVSGSGGTTGLTLSGGPITTTGTLTLGGTLIVANGGTGLATVPAYAVVIGGTTTAGPLQTVSGLGTTNYVLTSNGAGAAPTWQANPLGTVTSVSGSGGTTGLTLTGGPITTSGTLTLGGTLIVGNGGTGLASLTAYGIMTGGTTATGNMQQITPGTAGMVLISGGAASLPTFTATTGLFILNQTALQASSNFNISNLGSVNTFNVRAAGVAQIMVGGGTIQWQAATVPQFDVGGNGVSGAIAGGGGFEVYCRPISSGIFGMTKGGITLMGGTAGVITSAVAGDTVVSNNRYFRWRNVALTDTYAFVKLNQTDVFEVTGNGQTMTIGGKTLWGSIIDQGAYKVQLTGGLYLNTTGATFNITMGSDATGDIYYRNSSGNFVRLGIGSTNQVLTVIGGLPSWQPAGGGGGTPAGSTTQIQYNNAGAFGASAALTYSAGTVSIGAVATQGSIVLNGTTSGAITITTNAAAGTYTLTLPNSAGSSTQVLSTNGSGVLSWINTVSSVAGSGGTTGLTLSGGPITTTGTLTLGGTLVVANGGTGLASMTAYALLAGGTTATGNLQQIAGLGTSGQVLTSNGAAALPTWQTLAGSGTVTSVSGSGGTTGLTLTGGPITGSGTLTLGGTLTVANGGTGLASMTAYAVLLGGTTSTGNLQQVSGLGTTGQALISNGAGAAPTWQTISGTGTVTSVSGAGGSTGLTLTGGPITGSGTLTLGGTLVVANGGTGKITMTVYALLAGGTTSTGVLQQLTTGTAGQLLMSNGAAALPTWTDAPVSGNWTPTITNGTNVASSSANVCMYMRIGSFVICTGYVVILPTTVNIKANFKINLPIASNLGVTTDLSGDFCSDTTGSNSEGPGTCIASPSDDLAQFWFTPLDTSVSVRFNFMYKILP